MCYIFFLCCLLYIFNVLYLSFLRACVRACVWQIKFLNVESHASCCRTMCRGEHSILTRLREGPSPPRSYSILTEKKKNHISTNHKTLHTATCVTVLTPVFSSSPSLSLSLSLFLSLSTLFSRLLLTEDAGTKCLAHRSLYDFSLPYIRHLCTHRDFHLDFHPFFFLNCTLKKKKGWKSKCFFSHRAALPAVTKEVLFAPCRWPPVEDRWTEYITLCGLRKHTQLAGAPVTELIYVHSKMMIADDRRYIIGESALATQSFT